MSKDKKAIKRFFHGLTFNTIGAIIVLLFVFQVIVSTIGYLLFTRYLSKEYNESAFRTATTASALVSGDDVSAFLDQKDDILEDRDTETVRRYKECVSRIGLLCDTQDVNVIYVIAVNPDYKSFVSVINCPNKNSGYKPWEIGKVVDTSEVEHNAFYGTYKQMYEEGLERGTVMRTENLHGTVPHVTSAVPLKDHTGKVVSLLCVQRTMGELTTGRGKYLRQVIFSAVGLMILCTIFTTLYIKRHFILPIKHISDEAARFATENNAPEKPLSSEMTKISELSELMKGINEMEGKTLEYIENLSSVISEKQRMGAELHIASLIQEGSIPSIFPPYPDRKEFDIFASMTPAKEVGGDFYDFFLIDDDKLAMVMADVSGKGVPAALFMMVTKILINERAMMGGSPAEVLTFVNDRICDNNKAEMFVTVWLGILDLKTGVVTAANAGHDDPAVCGKDGKFRIVKNKHGLVVGAMKGVKYSDFEIKLEEGDKIFLYTDGVPEATDAEQKLFTQDGMIEALDKAADRSPKQVVEAVWSGINAFVKDAPQFDDVTMLCLEYRGASGEVRENDSYTIRLAATEENLAKAIEFVNARLESAGASEKTLMQVELAVEEIFINIAHYAYSPETGYADISVTLEDGKKAVIRFTDNGRPYDPLAADDPDVTLSAEDRKIGGLGVFMVKKIADAVNYRYEDGKNILTMEKTF